MVALTETMTEYNEKMVTKSLQLLRDGFMNEFATYVHVDERTSQLLMELATEFVQENIPVVDEDNQVELGMMLMENIDIIAR